MLLAATLLATSISGYGEKQKQRTVTMYMIGSGQADLPLIMKKVKEILEPKAGVKLDMILI